MIGAIEILMIAIIVGIIMGRDAIDKTFRKHPDESVMESLSVDMKDFYKDNPKRLLIMVLSAVGGIAFMIALIYWAWTRTDLPKMLGWGG